MFFFSSFNRIHLLSFIWVPAVLESESICIQGANKDPLNKHYLLIKHKLPKDYQNNICTFLKVPMLHTPQKIKAGLNTRPCSRILLYSSLECNKVHQPSITRLFAARYSRIWWIYKTASEGFLYSSVQTVLNLVNLKYGFSWVLILLKNKHMPVTNV